MDQVLKIEKLSKNYGRVKALQEVSFEVKKGAVFGLLGPNGSGKTTALGILLGVVNRKSGSFSWFANGDADENRKKIGAILEGPVFYPYMNAVQNLNVIARIKSCGTDRIETVLQLVGLFDRRTDAFKGYSLGMKQRLSIAAALLNDPEVLILDEPTNGLDPQGIADIRGLITKIAKEGRTIILASHLLDEVQKVCTDFAILRHGKLIYEGSVDDLNIGRIEMIAENEEALEKVLEKSSLVNSHRLHGDTFVVQVKPETSNKMLHKELIDNGIVLSHLKRLDKDLEQQFLDILAQQS